MKVSMDEDLTVMMKHRNVKLEMFACISHIKLKCMTFSYLKFKTVLWFYIQLNTMGQPLGFDQMDVQT